MIEVLVTVADQMRSVAIRMEETWDPRFDFKAAELYRMSEQVMKWVKELTVYCRNKKCQIVTHGVLTAVKKVCTKRDWRLI